MRLCDLLLACIPDSWNLFTYKFADRLLCSGIVEWAQAFARLQVIRHLCHAVVDGDALSGPRIPIEDRRSVVRMIEKSNL
jgi:hypothetical protein